MVHKSKQESTEQHVDDIKALAISLDRKLVVTASNPTGNIHVWDPATCEKVHTF
jgi:hypothetical protein